MAEAKSGSVTTACSVLQPMYLLTELILFSPLMVYACVRVRGLIPGPRLKRWFVFFYILLFLGYPLAEIISHRATDGWIVWVILCGYYCLPYLLYITLTVLAIDVAIAIALLTRLMSRDTTASAGIRRLRLICYLAIPALIVTWGAWDNNRLRVKTVSIELPRKSSALEELRIVFASDFHLSTITSDGLVERFIEKVNAVNPDIVLIGGDVLEGDSDEELNKFASQFRNLRSRYGVYAAPGNHERRRGNAQKFFERAGVNFLEDRVEKIDNSFYLAGRNYSRRPPGRKSIHELLNDASENLPVILLDHSPTDLENVSKSRADLQLSGHTHNGQLFPVNLVVIPFEYELPWGTRIKRITIFIASSGLQAWGPPVKTAGDSEILLIEVRFAGGPRIVSGF